VTDLDDRPTALYRFYDSAVAPLYFGIAVDPEARWRSHRRAPWWALVDADRTQVDWFPDRAAASRAEAAAIKADSPRHNRTHAEFRPECGVAMTAEEARLNFADMLNTAQWRREPVTITRHGQRVAVALSPEWFDSAVAALAAHDASPRKRA
jgi:prevent-host-death family protein